MTVIRRASSEAKGTAKQLNTSSTSTIQQLLQHAASVGADVAIQDLFVTFPAAQTACCTMLAELLLLAVESGVGAAPVKALLRLRCARSAFNQLDAITFCSLVHRAIELEQYTAAMALIKAAPDSTAAQLDAPAVSRLMTAMMQADAFEDVYELCGLQLAQKLSLKRTMSPS